MMDYWRNIGDLGKHKHVMSDELVKKEALKIRLFDGLFRCLITFSNYLSK